MTAVFRSGIAPGTISTPNKRFKLLTFVVSFALSYLVFELIFDQRGAVIIMMSLFFHELGHYLAFRYLGYTAGMFFIPLLGAAVYPDDPQRFRESPRAEEMLIASAGAMFNIALIVVGVGLAAAYDGDVEAFGLSLASLNAILTTFNLLPFGTFDGGRMAQAIFASADEKTDAKIALWATCIGVAGFFLTVWVSGWSFPLGIYLFVWGTHRASRMDDPNEHSHPRSMSRGHVLAWVWIWLAMISIGFITGLFLDFWNSY